VEYVLVDHKYALYWLAALRSGYVHSSQWISWADRQIKREQELEPWIIDLSLASNASRAEEVVSAEALSGPGKIDQDELNDATLGYIWLLYKEKRLGLSECLKRAAEYADNYEAKDGCEYLYRLVSRWSRGNHVEALAEKYFAPKLAVASLHLARLSLDRDR
jgi:hypothetical protein